MSRLRNCGLLAGLFVLLVLFAYRDPLFVRKNFAARDLLGYHLPVEKAIHDSYSRRRLPIWFAEISGGRPLLANLNAGALYPARPLLAAFSFPVAMRIFPVLHWALAGAGMIFLLRALQISLSGAWLGAVTYVFSGVGISEGFYTNIQPGMTWIPWIVWAALRSNSRGAARIALLSLFLGLDFLAGDVFTAGLGLVAAALGIALEVPKSQLRRRFLEMAGAVGLAALAALPQIVATALWIPHTARAVSGFRLGEALELSLSPLRLLELFIPFPFGETWQADPDLVWGQSVLSGRTIGFFSTLYAGALAPIALFAAWRWHRGGVRLGRACFLVGLALAVPGSLIPSFAKSWRSPLPLRHPEKFAVLVVFGLALLGGLAWERLRLADRIPRWVLGVGAGLAAAALAARLWPMASARFAIAVTGGNTSALSIAADRLAPALAEAGLLWAATAVALWMAAGKSRAGVFVSLLLLTAVPIAANRRIAPSFREEAVFAPTAFARAIRRADPSGRYRTLAIPGSASPDEAWASQDVGRLEYWRRSWLYYTPALWGRGTIFNQDADQGDLSRITTLRRLATLAAGFTDAGSFFGALALRWEIRFRGEPARAGYRRFGGDNLQDWDEHVSPFPDIRLLSRWREQTTALGALAMLPRLGPGEVVLETGADRTGSADGGTVRILERSPERLRLETETSAPTWLFVLRGYFPYREVLVDGRTTEPSPAQLAFSAIPVPAGRHRIDWTEQLPGGSLSLVGPVAFLAAVAALALRRGGKREAP